MSLIIILSRPKLNKTCFEIRWIHVTYFLHHYLHTRIIWIKGLLRYINVIRYSTVIWPNYDLTISHFALNAFYPWNWSIIETHKIFIVLYASRQHHNSILWNVRIHKGVSLHFRFGFFSTPIRHESNKEIVNIVELIWQFYLCDLFHYFIVSGHGVLITRHDFGKFNFTS